MNYWVFTVGLRDRAPPIDWLSAWDHHVGESWFPKTKRPVSVNAGDRAVVYGSRGRGFIAAVEVLSHEPEPNNDHPNDPDHRYPYKLRHRLLVSKAADHNVASPEAAGINPRRVVRGPHTQISAAEYQSAVEAMLEQAAVSAGTQHSHSSQLPRRG